MCKDTLLPFICCLQALCAYPSVLSIEVCNGWMVGFHIIIFSIIQYIIISVSDGLEPYRSFSSTRNQLFCLYLDIAVQ